MHIAGYIELGTIGKPEGTSGKLRLRPGASVPPDIELPEFVFVVHEGLPVPYRVLEAEIREKHCAVLLLNTIDTPEKVRAIGGLVVLIGDKGMCGRHDLLPGNREVIGYEVEDHIHGCIGTVLRVDERPGQDLLVVRHDTGTVLVPIVESIVTEVDAAHRTIRVELPEGLLDLNR